MAGRSRTTGTRRSPPPRALRSARRQQRRDRPTTFCSWTRRRWGFKQHPLTRAHLYDFVTCYNPGNRHHRSETDRFKRFTYEELIARDKVSLDLTWLRDESLQDTDNLPPPNVIAQEMLEEMQSALAELTALTELLEHKA